MKDIRDDKDSVFNIVTGQSIIRKTKRKSLSEKIAERKNQAMNSKSYTQNHATRNNGSQENEDNLITNAQDSSITFNNLKLKAQNLLKSAIKHPKYIVNKNKIRAAVAKTINLLPVLNASVKYVDYAIDYIMKADHNDKRSIVLQYTRGPAIFGIWVSILSLVMFLIWGVWAPLNSAAAIEGQLVLESKKRILQHQTGGIIQKIYVKEGEAVEKGKILISLDKTPLQAKYDSLNIRVINYELENSRLVAERDDLSRMIFKDHILANAGDPEVGNIIRTQEKLFNARRDTFRGKIKVRQEKIKQYEYKLESNLAQLEAINKQISIVQDQLVSFRKLASQGNFSKENLRRYEQQMADLQGRRSAAISDVAITKEIMSIEKLDIENDKTEFLSNVQRELRQNQDQLSYTQAEYISVQDELKRLDIVSPIDGVVNNLFQQTENGILSREQPFMEIVPQDDKLIFAARVRVDDIDVVRVGQKVSVKLSPFKARVVPSIDGVIVSLSADAIQPKFQGDVPHYNAKVEFDKKSLKAITDLNGIELYPGMGGAGLVEIGNRTLLRYLMDPITTSFDKAFIEQ